MTKTTKALIIVWVTILVWVGIYLNTRPCKTAGCWLDKQITIENQIKKLNVELKAINTKKSKLYVEGINDWVQTGTFTKAPQQEQLKLPTTLSWVK